MIWAKQVPAEENQPGRKKADADGLSALLVSTEAKPLLANEFQRRGMKGLSLIGGAAINPPF
jgi:hypothetical protein